LDVEGDPLKTLLVVVLYLAHSTAFGQPGIYRAPNTLTKLPTDLRIALEKQGCTIPLAVYDYVNVIKGSFAKQGQTDWAVLCSVAGNAHIQVFWGGPARCPDQVAARPDSYYLYTDSIRGDEYYRGLGVVGKEFIIKAYEGYGGPKPPPITHDAIDDKYIEKGSVVHSTSPRN